MELGPRAWYRGFRETASEGLSTAAFYSLYYTYLSLFFTLTSRYPLGVNVYDRDWDLLVVLDACRPDALHAVADEYPFLERIETVWSRGSMSEEWLAKTFTTPHLEAVERTAMITSNRYIEPVLSNRTFPRSTGWAPFGWPDWNVVTADDFAHLDPVWRYARSERLKQVPPRVLTDHAITLLRRREFERTIVHHLQPHHPFIARAVRENDSVTTEEAEVMAALRDGRLSRREAWRRYLDNLRLVLDETALLLDNVDAQTVAITADHGELFGRYGLYGHPCGVPIPSLRRVPWVETTAADRRTHDPVDHRSPSASPTRPVTAQLAELGYR